MPAVVYFTESRMREICTSGSKRGEWIAPFVGSSSLLLYRLEPVERVVTRQCSSGFLRLAHRTELETDSGSQPLDSGFPVAGASMAKRNGHDLDSRG